LLEEAATNLRDRLLIRILFHLGCRVSEALAIKVEDIDFTQGTVIIVHLKRRVRLSCPHCGTQVARSHGFCPECGGRIESTQADEQQHRRQRVLPADNHTLKMLKDYIRRGGPVEKDGTSLIFGINRHRAWQVIRECAQRAGLPKLLNPDTGRIHNVSPHSLRDAFAVHAVKVNDTGDGLRMLQEHLGHASFNTTARYRKVAGEELKTWYAKLWEQEDGH